MKGFPVFRTTSEIYNLFFDKIQVAFESINFILVAGQKDLNSVAGQ